MKFGDEDLCLERAETLPICEISCIPAFFGQPCSELGIVVHAGGVDLFIEFRRHCRGDVRTHLGLESLEFGIQSHAHVNGSRDSIALILRTTL
jgi:hypothetical protein